MLGRAQGLRGPADGQPGGHRGVPAARRRRRDRPVELPGVHADGLDRLRPRRRQRGRLQAQRVHPRRRRVAGRHASPRSCRTARCSRWSPATARPAPRCAAPASTSSPSPAPPRTGKKVMAACAETLTPVLIEAGGKDALLVDEDADLDAAADAAVWGALSNAGQTCVGVERVYVARAGLRRVPRRLAARPQDLRAGGGRRRPDRPDHHALAARRHPRATSTTRSPAAAGRVVGGADAVRRALRPADGPRRRPRGLARRSPRRPSGRPSRSPRSRDMDEAVAAPTPRATAWASRCSPRPAGTSSPAGCAPA